MEKINICYIDDRIDNMLSRYIDNYCKEQNKLKAFKYDLVFSEYNFEDTDNYKTLLNNSLVNKANIIVIDSRLFENENSHLSKFTGEQFKIIIRQILPFIKTIVISQNATYSESLTIQKFQSRNLLNSIEASQKFYTKELGPILTSHIFATIEEFNVLSQLENDNEIDPVLIGTIQSTIAGLHDNALFEKEDLNKLIELFNEVKNNYDN